jgi:RNA polymerase sigma-70 factor (ECF subfamily)
MLEHDIVSLYFQRSEEAIKKTKQLYERYCMSIAYSILENREDAEEVVNDTWMAAWESIPPNDPSNLKLYLGKITRRKSFNVWRKEHVQKRGGGEIQLCLDELEECIPAESDVEMELEMEELQERICDFVRHLPATEQKIFVCRYWYVEPIHDIAKRFGFSESKVKVVLYRIRKRLKVNLEQGGYS